jgi:hypothetical protein
MFDLWKDSNIDALVMPNYPIPAFKEENVGTVGAIRDYQFLWSLIHYPAGCVPVMRTNLEQSKNAAELYDTDE